MAPRSRFNALTDWLDWQQTLNPSEIDLGLERVQVVAARMTLSQPPFKILTIGGTNGKGSAVAFLEAILSAMGYRTGAYTSPHLLRYNERIRIAGQQVSDQQLCAAFAAVDQARADVPLTFFEFGTLAALHIFRQQNIQIALLEVGLGGRLDAVNAFAAVGALITSIGIDHCEWLGNDRQQIAWEKAGIYRKNCPAICADRKPPQRLIQHAQNIGADLRLSQRDYDFSPNRQTWRWSDQDYTFTKLPLPAMIGSYQLDNAAGAIALLCALGGDLVPSPQALHQGLSTAHIVGRFERLNCNNIEIILDVAHNPQAAQALAQTLAGSPVQSTHFVWGMLADKACEEVLQELSAIPQSYWYLADLQQESRRGATAERLHQALQRTGIIGRVLTYNNVAAALAAAIRAAQHSDAQHSDAQHSDAQHGNRVVVGGSFYTVAAALRANLEEMYRGSSA